MKAIHQAALEILERTGMWVDHAKALECLRTAGCRVDTDRRIVRFRLVEEVGTNGHTFDHEHTAAHYRGEELLSPFFESPSWDAGDSLDRERFEKRAAAKVRELLAIESPPVLTAEQIAAIDEIVKEATVDLGASAN